MLNRIILIGRLTRDPEAKYTPSGVPVTTFSVAVDRPQSAEARQSGQPKETDFIDIVTWRQTAEFAANYLQKGRLVAVEGKLQIRSYVTQDGQQRKAAEVVADNVRPLDKPRDGSEGGDGDQGGGYEQRPQPQAQQARGGYERGGGGGGYEQQRPAAGGNRGASAPAGARGGNRNAPPADNFDDMEDISDPFAE
jgi:single-strand DNA-binding protein